jgi:signal transduction histidine kinase
MNINTKHWLATGTALAAIGLIALAIVWTETEVEDASRQRRQTTEIVQRYTELRLASFDYLRNREERARAQWYAVSARIDRLIAANHFLEPEHAAILAGLRARRAVAPQLFAELEAMRDEDFANAALRRRFEAQLVSRLLIDQQDSLADAFRLTEVANQRIERAQRRVVMVILAGLGLFGLIIGGLSLVIRRQVLAPMIRLQRATRDVAAGNLDLKLGPAGNDEIGDLSRNFDAMTQALRESFARIELGNRELAALNTELEAFNYSVAHDLRAPLRSLDGFSLALIEDYGDKLDAHGRDTLARIGAASQHMDGLIDGLLRLSRMGRSVIKPTRVDLSAMAGEIADEISRESPKRFVEWAIEPGLSIRADPALLRIAMQNLLQNAWKYTGRTDRPVIRVGARQRGTTDATEYYVADNGAGFDMKYADRLFGAFQRLHRAEDFPGTGIGLAIVKRIIRRHGGNIRAEAEPGKGATFFFSLQEAGNEQHV